MAWLPNCAGMPEGPSVGPAIGPAAATAGACATGAAAGAAALAMVSPGAGVNTPVGAGASGSVAG